jgi:hypothetical protein
MAQADESAIARAIKMSEDREGQNIFFPYEGTRFNSFKEAKEPIQNLNLVPFLIYFFINQ